MASSAGNPPPETSPRQSSTELLLNRCVELGEIEKEEASMIISHWKGSQTEDLHQRTKELHAFIMNNFAMNQRSNPIWQSMINQQKVSMQQMSAEARKAKGELPTDSSSSAAADSRGAAQSPIGARRRALADARARAADCHRGAHLSRILNSHPLTRALALILTHRNSTLDTSPILSARC